MGLAMVGAAAKNAATSRASEEIGNCMFERLIGGSVLDKLGADTAALALAGYLYGNYCPSPDSARKVLLILM